MLEVAAVPLCETLFMVKRDASRWLHDKRDVSLLKYGLGQRGKFWIMVELWCLGPSVMVDVW